MSPLEWHQQKDVVCMIVKGKLMNNFIFAGLFVRYYENHLFFIMYLHDVPILMLQTLL